jgi:hypothetical protein
VESLTSWTRLSAEILLNSGTDTPPAIWMAKSIITQAGEEGAMSPTDSPLHTPRSTRPRAMRFTRWRSSAWETGIHPSPWGQFNAFWRS